MAAYVLAWRALRSLTIHNSMARNDPLEEPPEAEESYHDSADEDFDPTTAPADESSSSSDEEDAPAKAAQPKRKRKAPAIDELDSGDEVTIEAAKKRKSRKRKGDKGRDEDDLMFSDDEGGEGGLVKTRAQRRVEYVFNSSIHAKIC